MKTLADFRRQYPQYDDMGDAELAEAIHQKFYSDLPKEQVFKKLDIQLPKTASVQEPVQRGTSVAARLAELSKEERAAQERLNRISSNTKEYLNSTLGKIVSAPAQLFGAKTAAEEALDKAKEDRQEAIERINRERAFIEREGRVAPELTVGQRVTGTLASIPRGAIEGTSQFLGTLGITGSEGEQTARAMEERGTRFAENLGLGANETAEFDPIQRNLESFGGGLGSVLPYVATELIGKKAAPLTKAAPYVARGAQAILGAGQGATQARQQMDEFEQETGQKVDPTTRKWVQLGGATIGLTELLPISGMVNGLPAPIRTAVTKRITDIVARTGVGKLAPEAARTAIREVVQGLESRAVGRIATQGILPEALQEGGTQLAQNVLERTAYNPEQELMEGVAENAILGGLVGGTVHGVTEVAQKALRKGKAEAQNKTPAADSPDVQQEFLRLIAAETQAIKDQTPGMTQRQAYDQVVKNSGKLYDTAISNILFGAEGDTNVDTGVDVVGGSGAGAATNIGTTPPVSGTTDLGETIGGQLDGPISGLPVSDVGAGAGVDTLIEPTAKQVKAMVPTIEQAFEASALDFEDAYGDVLNKNKKLNAQQKTLAARILVQSPEVDPYDAIGSVLDRGLETLTGKPVPKKAPSTSRTMITGPANAQELQDKLTTAIAAINTKAADEKAAIQKQIAPPVGAAPDVVSLEPTSMAAPEMAAPEMAAPEMAAPETAPAPVLEEPVFDPADYTPQEIYDDLTRFGNKEAERRGYVFNTTENGMFGEGVREAKDPNIKPLTDEQILADNGPEVLAAYKEGQQFGIDAVAAVRGAPEATSEAAPIEGDPENEGQALTANIQNTVQSIADDFMVGDSVRVGSLPGTVVGLDGDYVRVRPDSARNAKAYHRVPKTNLQLVSRPDTASTVSASKSGDQDAKFGQEDGQLNADMAGLIQLLGANMYAANIADVSVKELLQNAFDAIKGAVSGKRSPSLYKAGKVEIIINSKARTITIKDDARGMTPEIVRDAFFTVAGSDKSDLDPSERSGGLGLAKMGFMMGAKSLKLDTVRDGVRVTVDATSKDIAGSTFKINKSPAPQNEHGTTVTVEIPENYTDPRTGEKKTIWFPYDKSSVEILGKPLIGPVEVEFTYQGDYGAPNTEVLPMGVNFPFDKYQQLQAKFEWGTVDIYYGKERKKYPNHQILSSGVYQFNERFKLDQNSVIPYDIIVNVKPDVEAKHPDYPFENSREKFKGRLKADIEALSGYLAKIARGAEAADLKDTMQNVVSLPRVEDSGDIKGLEGKLKKSFEQGDGSERVSRPVEIPTEVTITTEGVFDNGGRTVWDRTKEAEKKKAATFEAETDAPTRDDFMIELDQDPKNPIFHNNTNFDPITIGEPYGNPGQFFAELGSILVGMKEFLAKSGIYGYDALSPDNLFYGGLGIDKGYGGLHIKVPYKAVLLNPFYDWGARTLSGIRGNMLNTMIHEIAHTGDMDHGVGHNNQMLKVEQYLYDEGMYDYYRDAIMDILLRHESVFTAMRDEYGRSTTQNIAKSLEDYAKNNSASSEDGGNGNDGSDASRSVPAGEGRGGRGNIQAAASANKGSEKRGGTGSGAQPKVVSNGKPVVLTEAQKRSALAKAKAQREKMNRIQKRIASTNDTADVLGGGIELAKLVRGDKENLALLRGAVDTLNVAKWRAILPTLSTEDILRILKGRNPGLTETDRLIRRDINKFETKENLQLADQLEVVAEFLKKYPKAAQALSDLEFATVAYQVDPTKSSTPEEYFTNIDGRAKELRAKIKVEKDPKKKGQLEGKLKTRLEEIKSVYIGVPGDERVFGWRDLGRPEFGGNKGKEIFKLLRDAHRRDLDAKYEVLRSRLMESKKDEKLEEALDKLEAQFKPAREQVIYFPAMRFGSYYARVGKGTNSIFKMFETEKKRNQFVRVMEARGEDVSDVGNIEDLRNDFEGVTGGPLKEVLDLFDDNPKDIGALKNQVFDLWLQTMSAGDMRKHMAPRGMRAGYSTDILKNFANFRRSSINDVKRAKFGYKLRNEISRAKDFVKDQPDRAKMEAFIKEIELRALSDLMPPDRSHPNWEAAIRFGNKAAFYQYLANPKTAVIQLTQLHVVVLPMLAQKYGSVKATAALSKYGFAGLGGFVASPLTSIKNKDGSVSFNWEQPNLLDNPISALKKESDPELYEVLSEGWNEGRDLNLYMDTFANDIGGYGMPDPKQRSALQELMRGRVDTATLRGATFAFEAMGTLMHQMERVNREATYMAVLELAYRENRKKKQSHAEAKKDAIEAALDTTLAATFDFSSYNKPRILATGVGRISGQFMSYPYFMSSLLVRSTYTAIKLGKLEPGERLAAAQTATGALLNIFLYAGLTGVPLYGIASVMGKMVAWLLDDDDEENGLSYIDKDGNIKATYDFDWWFRNVWIPKFFGADGTVANLFDLEDDTAELLALSVEKGPISAITDIDLSNSVALDFMFFLPKESRADTPEGKITDYTFSAVTGAAGNTFMDYLKGGKDLMNGYTNRALEKAPKLFGNVAKANRFAEEGQTNYNRELVGMDKDFWTNDKAILQALSFASTEADQRQQQNYEGKSITVGVEKARGAMLDKFRKVALDRYQYGTTQKVDTDSREVLQELAKFNQKYPTHVIGIDTLYETQTNAIDKALRSKAVRGVPMDESGKTPYLRDILKRRVEAEGQ